MSDADKAETKGSWFNWQALERVGYAFWIVWFALLFLLIFVGPVFLENMVLSLGNNYCTGPKSFAFSAGEAYLDFPPERVFTGWDSRSGSPIFGDFVYTTPIPLGPEIRCYSYPPPEGPNMTYVSHRQPLLLDSGVISTYLYLSGLDSLTVIAKGGI